ncbi:1931_t:CDS:2, partial [Cetraspora pellucida]
VDDNFFELNNTEFNNLQNHTNMMGHQHSPSNDFSYLKNNNNSYCAQVKEYMNTLPILDVNEKFVELNNTVFDNLKNHINIMDHQYSPSNDFLYLKNNENSYCAQVKGYIQAMDTLPIFDVDENFFNLNNTEFNNLQDYANIIDQQWSPFNNLSYLKNMKKDLETTENIEVRENNNRMYTYPIALEMDFMNWEDLNRWLDNHGVEHGFAFTVTHSEKDKEDRIPRRRTYSDCQFHVNAYRHKKDNKIYITKIDGQHNHALINNIEMVATHYQRLTPEMHDNIKLLASCEVHARAIIEVLQKKNPGKYIHVHNVYNAIQMNRIQRKTISDAGLMYLELIKHQQADPTFYVDLWARFHDVVLLDTTAKTNHHSMILCVIILIDNYNHSRLAVTAVVSDETKDTFIWLFGNIVKATGGLASYLLYMDADPAMIAAVNACWPATKHHFCLFHICKNLEKHLLVTGSSTLLELENNIKKLLEKESRFTRLNESIGQLPVNREESYYNRYFNKIDISCQKFLTPAILKLQRNEINRSIYYRCFVANLKDELENCACTKSPTGMFSEDLFDANIIELEQLIASLEWTKIIEVCVTTFESEPVISLMSNKEFNELGHAIHIDFSHLEDTCRNHIFTKHISREMTRREQWEKGFGILKKALNLAIMTNRTEELYEIYAKLIKEMENKIESQDSQVITENNKLQEFTCTINNLISIKTKGRSRNNMSDTESISNMEETPVNKRKCGICNLKGHNARTCSNLAESNIVELESANINEKTSTNKQKCRICSLEVHNAQMCPNFIEYSGFEMMKFASDTEENTNKRKCSICDLKGHNA